MNLSVKYLGLNLNSPVIAASSSITSTIDNLKKLEQNGVGAVVLKSLFEEQIMAEASAKLEPNDMYFWYPEAADYVRNISSEFGVNAYLDFISNAKKNVKVPVIASINCVSPREWTKFSAKIEEAGADALELNIAFLPFEEEVDANKILNTYQQIVAQVKKSIKIPVAVKLSPYFSNLVQLSKTIQAAGADGLVLFNRLYQPDIDIEGLEVISKNYLSAPEEITNSIRWVGLISSKVSMDIAASTGIYDHEGVIKQLLAGASAVQLASTFYRNGLDILPEILKGVEEWMSRKRFQTIADFKGKIGESKIKTAAFERIQYIERTTNHDF